MVWMSCVTRKPQRKTYKTPNMINEGPATIDKVRLRIRKHVTAWQWIRSHYTVDVRSIGTRK